MPVITDIKPQRKNKNRYNIYIDDEYAFSLSDELIVTYDLKIDKKVDTVNLQTMVFEDEQKKAFDRALNYLNFRMRTENEMKKYLKDKGFDEQVVYPTIDKLKEYGLLDDYEFACRWVKNSIKTKPAGRKLIMYQLRQKGISDDIASEALKFLGEDEEYKSAYELGIKYYSRYNHKTMDERAKRSRIGQALARKGFDWDIIQNVIRQIFED